jgi:OOP family OmpA-OmpF porin
LKVGSRAGGKVAACLSLSLAWAPAFGQYEDDPLPTWYAGPMAGYAFADTDRGARDGINLHLVAGRAFREGVALELNLFGTTFDADTAGADTDVTGAGLDLALGLPAGGYPVFLLGAGAAQQDIGGESKALTFGNLGLGMYLPFSFGGELWRLEARYHVLMGEHPSLPGEDPVEDVRVNFGVLFAFGREEAPPPEPESQPPPPPAPQPEPAPPAEEEPLIAPPSVDADGDGVADAQDACPGTSAGSVVDARGCVVPENVVIRSAYFGSSSSSLTARGYALLHDVAAALRADPAMRLEVEGHSDMSGPAVKNLPLSQERAEVARAVLVELGIAPERLVAKGYGETRPVNDNKTLEKRAFNRRVQFRRLDRAAP